MEYVRYHIDDISKTGHPTGIFVACWRLQQRGLLTEAEDRTYLTVRQWFLDNLNQPPFYEHQNPEGAITYFKRDTTVDMQARLVPLIDLLESHGVRVRVSRVGDLNGIVYEDEYQVSVVLSPEDSDTGTQSYDG